MINAKKTGQQMQTYQAMCCNRCKNIALCWGKKHEDMFEILLFAEAHDKILKGLRIKNAAGYLQIKVSSQPFFNYFQKRR